jgi:TonB family protein
VIGGDRTACYRWAVRRVLTLLLVAACRHPAASVTPAAPERTVPRLRPPPVLDASVRGSAYLAAVALQVQPGWGQFLDDCRLRLPAAHPLNDLSLAATAELTIEPRGQLVDIAITTSGNADFDRAVRDALRDADPLPAPPPALWSDDDRVHLRWLFARDRRQAGPATAEVIQLDLPLGGVIDKLVRSGDLSRAARRILRAPPSAERDGAIRTLVIAALREGLGSPDGTVRRAAVEAIGRAGARELAGDVRALLTGTNDSELRVVAIATAAALGDDPSAVVLLEQLKADLVENARLARAEILALVQLHREADVAAVLRGRLDRASHPDPVALEGAGLVALPELTRQIGAWLARGDARTRAAACSALASVDAAAARPLLARGLDDRDAAVRAACVTALRDPKLARAKLRVLARDRDEGVRAEAVRALVRVDASVHGDAILADSSAHVRAAYASALPATSPDLAALLADRDPDVRAAAWTRYVHGERPDKALTAAAATDPAPQVRRAAIPVLDDDALITRLATSDEATDVRTDALVHLATRRGRGAITDMLLVRFADAEPGTAERVRTSLAWLLAP